MLTFALAKGRLAKLTLEALSAAGVARVQTNAPSRRLVFENADAQTRFFLAKPSDVPTFVEYGAADLGVAGKDTLLEEKRDLYETHDFGFGCCRMVVAGLPVQEGTAWLQSGARLRVATKYPSIAADYFNRRGVSVEIIKLSGSIELAPMVGLADVIVDITETGQTLIDNGLALYEEIMPLSARLIVNRVSMKLQYERITEIINKLKGV